MKNITTIIGALLFSTFFYKQHIGLNLLLFSIVTVIILLISNFDSFKKRKTILNALAYLITGIAVYFYKSNLAIIANIIGFITLVGSVSENKSSIYIKWLNGLYTSIAAAFSLYFDSLFTEVKNVKKKKIDIVYWLKIVGIPTIILLVYIGLYRNGNPLFDEIISKIDLSFINLQWILLAALGYYLFYNISQPITIEPTTVTDINTGNSLEENSLKKTSEKKLESEKQLGIVLIVLLNTLIALYLTTDVFFISKISHLNAVELSQKVHSGINALIVSIVLAIVIIIYFFRGYLNFYQRNQTLKTATYVWLLLNLVLVFITVFKNYVYISSFGFTYKRIGVFIYLFLAFFGLITTFYKVYNIQNIWFLFRKNIQVAFILLMTSTVINWDKIITNYNIKFASQTDMEYLLNLSNNNVSLLKEYSNNNSINNDYKLRINRKHKQFLDQLKNNSWQEMTIDNLKYYKIIQP